MNLINKEQTDLSEEVYCSLAIMLEMVWALQIMNDRLARAMTRNGYKDTIFQNKKYYINRAQAGMKMLADNLVAGFDGVFDKVFSKVPGEEVKRTDLIARHANDVIRLLLVYYSRVDGADEQKVRNMQKALENFKVMPHMDFLEEELKFYSLD